MPCGARSRSIPMIRSSATICAAVLMRLHQHAEARDLLAELVVRQGPQPTLLCNLANATLSLGLQEEAEGIARQAIELAPAAVLPWRTLCNTLPYRDGVSGQELLSALRSCSERLPRDRSPPFCNDADPDRRLRVGLLSGTLKTHPVGLADDRRVRGARPCFVRDRRTRAGHRRRSDRAPLSRRRRRVA